MPVSLGASILAFVTLVAKLSHTTAAICSSIKDAPRDVRRVQTGLEDLEAVLGQVDYICSMNPECVGDPATESYWSAKKARLRSDFAELGGIVAQLTERAKRALINSALSLL